MPKNKKKNLKSKVHREQNHDSDMLPILSFYLISFSKVNMILLHLVLLFARLTELRSVLKINQLKRT